MHDLKLSMEMLVPKWELPIANAKDFCGSGNHMVVGRGMLLTLIGEAIGTGVSALLSPMLSCFL
ncbi:MAG: hypothetical protein DMG65_22595 [Candidatus Angelobacter sp. Gp1-AA117]|nr:MAG: hypothetical protein DMG65_22595 [Candidatus Angelobacter sp. Gp1-AA117]